VTSIANAMGGPRPRCAEGPVQRIQWGNPASAAAAADRSADFHAHAVAHPEEPPRPRTNAATGAIPAAAFPAIPYWEALAFLVAALAVTVVGYLVVVVPGAWFPSAETKAWAPREFALSRGSGTLDRGALAVTANPAAGGVLITVDTDFRSADYPAVAWSAVNVPDDADVRLVWRSDYAPAKVNSAPIALAAGQLLPVTLAADPNWVGHIRGLGLAINGVVPQPVRVLGVAAKPMGAVEIVGDRLHEWIASEGFTGTSIDGVTGGADVQDLPLPVLLATAVLLAAFAWLAVARIRARVDALPAVLATLFVAAWALQDVRWTFDLVRQARATATTYAGLDWRERHLAAEDAALFKFIQSVRAKLPAGPARVFMNADAHYFRDRGAYHLYPHNVYFEPYRNAIPASSQVRSGDYFIVFQRRGVQWDADAHRLRWDGFEPVSAELLLTAPGAALFRIR
jgi:hypothetical protein